MPPLDTVDMLHGDGSYNPGGIGTVHGYALLSAIITLQAPAKPDAVGATLATIGSITTAHVFAADQCMKKIRSTENKGSVKVTAGGELDGENERSEFKFNYPGSKAELDGLRAFMRSNDCAFFAKEADGTVRQIGSAEFPARLSVNYGTGENNDAYRGYECTVKAFGPAPIYTPGLNFVPAE
jgi:hypothetical protein